MKAFFKRYSYDIVRAFLSHFIFGIFAITVTAVIAKTNALKYTVFAVSTFMYVFILYGEIFKVGQRDALRKGAPDYSYNPLIGLYIGLCASLFDFVILILNILYFGFGVESDVISTTLSIFYFSYDGLFEPLIFMTSDGTAEGYTLYGNKIWFFVLTFLPCLVTCSVSYIMGIKNKHLTKLFIPENPEEHEIKADKKREKKSLSEKDNDSQS